MREGTTATAAAWTRASDGHVLTLLDGFGLQQHGRPVPLPAGSQRLVALLGLGGARSRAVAAGTLWPDVGEDRARGSLRTALWRLHRRWPGLVALTDHRLALDPSVRLDTERFVARAMRLVDGPADLAPEELRLDGLAVGDLLPGWSEDWVVFERERLRQLRMHALEQLSARLVARGRFALALDAALEAIRAEPLRESAHFAVITVHVAEGNLVEARRHYDTLRLMLRAELQVEPSPRLTALLPPAIGTPEKPAHWTGSPDGPQHREHTREGGPPMEPVSSTIDVGLEAVRRHRAELRESISALEQALAAPAPGRVDAWAERVHVALVELSADFREHIQITEGADGLYQGVLTTAPRLSNAVTRLTREHAEIGSSLDDLLTRVGGPPVDDVVDGIRDIGTALLARLARHRQRGADLVYEAYQSDIGGEN